MKQTLGIVRYNFFGFFRNPKVIFILFLEFVLSFLLTGRIMVVMDNYNTPVQAIEPFLWTFGDRTAVLLSSMLLLLLFSDLPKMTPVTPYQLIRTTKKKWLLGQFVYITFVTILYTCFMLLFTSVLCMQNIDITTISKWLGHKRVTTTLNIYEHILEQGKEQVVNCVSDVILKKHIPAKGQA